jgi:hypothetical protein
MTSDAKLTSDEMRLLYQVTVGDLTYFKKQQWSATNYALVLLAGLVAVAQTLRSTITSIERLSLVVLAVLIAGGALTVLFKLQRSIRVRQARLDAARSSFSAAFNAAWAADTKGREYVHSVYFLYMVVLGGATVVCWLVLRVA